MLTFAYRAEGEFNTRLNIEEVDEEIWIAAREALAQLELPYQIRAAVFTIAQFRTVADLFVTLKEGSIDEDFFI
jgi:hypothetical protein